MQLRSIFTILVASAAMAMAGDVDEDITTTSTSTMTMTVTITECNPTATDCPSYKPPKVNTTTSTTSATPSAHPTWYHKNETSWAVPTQKGPTAIETSVVVVPTKAKSSGSAVPTSGASGLFLQSGLMLSLVGAGVALLA